MSFGSRLDLLKPTAMNLVGQGTNCPSVSNLLTTNPTNVIEIFITHIRDDGPLLKICAQNDRMAAVFVERLIISYKDSFNNCKGQPKSPQQLSVGLLCCAKYDDSEYYRARILDFVRPDKVSVVFVDYGNTALIPIMNIRLLDNLGNDQALANIHDLSVEYILGGIVPRKAEWDARAIEMIKQKLCYIDVRCQIITEICGKKLIKIILENQDFLSFMVNNNLGFPLPIQAHEVLVAGIYGKNFDSSQFKIPPPPLPRAPAIAPPIKPSQDSLSYISAQPRFLSEMLIPGSEHLVYVSHVEDGPFTFAVQLKSVAEKSLTKLMAELNDHELKPISGPLIPGCVCLGRFSEDQSLCRAIVMNVLDDKCKLYYADYGNSEILPYSEIFEVPPQYVGLKVMALRFTLANIRGQVFSDDVKAFFKQLVTDKQVVIKVTPPEASPLKQYCEMFMEGHNVKQLIMEKVMEEQPLSYNKLHVPIIGTKEKVLVTYVENVNSFFIQLDSNKEALNTVMSCVAGHCQSGAPLLPNSKLRPGVACCALYPVDQIWYRAQILSVEDDLATVLFVDFGNQDTVPKSSLREIHRDLVTKVRTQALQCCLSGFQNKSIEETTCMKFEELTLENEFLMHIMDFTSNQIPVVNLYDNNQCNLASQLLPTTTASSKTVAQDEWEEDVAPQQPILKNDYNSHSGNDGGKAPFSDDSRNKQWKSRENEDGRSSKFGSREEKNKWGRDTNEKFSKGGRDKDEMKGPRFSNDDNKGSGFKYHKFDKDEDNDRRKFGRTRDGDDGVRYGDRGGGGKHDKSSSFSFKRREEGGGGDTRRYKDGEYKKESSGFKQDNEYYKKSFDNGDGPRFSSRNSNRTSSHGESRSLTIPQSVVKVGSTEVVEVVYSVSPSEFYVQVSSESEKLSTLMSEIATAFESGSEETLEIPKKGQFCIAKYSEDETWYRGCIESTNTDSANVLFVDYGNREEVSKENIKKITSSLTSLPVQGVKCELFGCVCAGETWTEEEILNFTTNCEGKTLKAQFVEKVFLTNTFKVVLTDEETGVVINSVPEADIEAAVDKMNQTSLYPHPINLGITMRVQLSWFISPSLFYVQPLDHSLEFKSMIEHMQSVAKKGVPKSTSQLKAGDNIIARFKEDKVLYRASVRTVGFEPVVTYVDYGNCAKVEAGMTWELEPQYCILPEQAICCTLSGVIPSDETWGTTNIDSYFMGDEFCCTFIKALEGETKGYAVQLMNGEKNIADQLVADGLAVEGSVYAVEDHADDGDFHMELGLLVGQILSIVITHIESSEKFYINLLPNQTQVLEIKAVETFPADQLECGTLCTVKNENQCLRSRIVDTESLLVQFIDIGEVKQVHQEELFVLPAPDNDLNKHPALAIECSLEMSEQLSEELEAQFKETVTPKPHIAYIKGIQNDKLQVVLYETDGQLYLSQGESSETVDAICPLPLFQSHQKVTISHAGEDSIYLHKTDFSEVLSMLLESLYNFYNEKEFEEHEWKVGMYCAAKSSSDEQWYRAKIMALDSEITVKYIDYGNNEVLPQTSLRILDASFYNQHELAFKVKFHVQWLVPVETLLEIVEENVYNAVVIRNNDLDWLAELMSQEGVSLTDSLIELGFVTALEDSPFKRIVEGGRFVAGSDLSVSVSHIDSPSQIWLLIVRDIEVVEELQDRLQESANRLQPMSQPTGMFAAKYSDGMWYRAIHIADNIVRFIDYGNSDEVDMSDLKELTSDFAEPAEGYAVKCELFVEPKEDAWHDDCKQKLEELLIGSEELIAHILEVKESSVVADLLIGSKSVSDILVELDLANTPQKRTNVFICHINSPSDFYIHSEGSELQLEDIAENLLLAENFEELQDISTFSDKLVAAKYSVDDLWYRAKVLQSVENVTTVLFVDYGNCADVSEFKALPTEIAAKPFVANHCCLKLPSGVEKWSEAAAELFEELAAGGTNVFKMVQKVQGEPNTVALFTSNGLSVANELKTVCITHDSEQVNETRTSELVGSEEGLVSWIEVYVSHSNSPEDFYLQLSSSTTDLEEITGQLSQIDSFPVLSNPAEWIGKLVAGKCFCDGLLYRAKVLDYNETGITVFYVDYGNSEVIDEIRELPENLVKSNILAIHCLLKLPEGVSIWSSSACIKFAEIVSDKTATFEMCVLESTEPKIISLRQKDGLKVENILLELCEIYSEPACQNSEMDSKIVNSKEENLDEIPIVREAAGDFFSVFISHINSPNDFYVQKEGCETSLKEIENSLICAEQFSDLKSDNYVELIGEIVASQYPSDNLWYRSKILDVVDAETTVLFVDFGNTANVTNIKELPQDIKQKIRIAQRCTLNQPKELEDWSESACLKFIELASEGTTLLELRILKKCDDVNVVDLYYNGQSVTDMLTNLCLPKMNISEMADLILDSVQNRRAHIAQEEKEVGDIFSEAFDETVKLDTEVESKVNDNEETKDNVSSLALGINNRTNRNNIDEIIVPGCLSQYTEVDNFEESIQDINREDHNYVDPHSNTIADTEDRALPIVAPIEEKKFEDLQISSKENGNDSSIEKDNSIGGKDDFGPVTFETESDPVDNELKVASLTEQSDIQNPKLPRRLNIDEHIVPGCVSQIPQ